MLAVIAVMRNPQIILMVVLMITMECRTVLCCRLNKGIGGVPCMCNKVLFVYSLPMDRQPAV